MDYFPIFTNLQEKSVLVIGQYRVLEFKIDKLLQAGAKVRFLSDTLSSKMELHRNTGKIDYYKGRFKKKYLRGIWLVICGSSDAVLKDKVARETEKRNILCNFVDEPALCSFISPAVITKGGITIAISTGGKSPALIKHLKQKIDTAVGDEYKDVAALLGKVRQRVIDNIPDQKRRGALFDRMITHPEILDLLKNNKHEQAEQLVSRLIDEEIGF